MLSKKTIERLILYKKILEECAKDTTHIYSHQLSELTGFSAAQIRRDIMSLGYSGTPKSGYEIKQLNDTIKTQLEPKKGINMILIGVGNLGRAILTYFQGLKPAFSIIASFDSDLHKAGRVISGCQCHHIKELGAVIENKNVQLAIVTVPGAEAQGVTDALVQNGIFGLVNFTPARVKVPDAVFIEHIDMRLQFEKVAYFARNRKVNS